MPIPWTRHIARMRLLVDTRYGQTARHIGLTAYTLGDDTTKLCTTRTVMLGAKADSHTRWYPRRMQWAWRDAYLVGGCECHA